MNYIIGIRTIISMRVNVLNMADSDQSYMMYGGSNYVLT